MPRRLCGTGGILSGMEGADERAKAYEALEVKVLEVLAREVVKPDVTASVIAAAVSMLRAGGVQARTATAGQVGSDGQALSEWLRGLPPDQALVALRNAAATKGTGKAAADRRKAVAKARAEARSAAADLAA